MTATKYSQAHLRLAREEAARRAQRERWRRYPLEWLRDRLGEDPAAFMWSKQPGYEAHNWDGDKDPMYAFWKTIARAYTQAKEGIDPEIRIAAMEAATGTGKTFMLARIAFWFLDCFPNSLVITTAPVQTQLKVGLWGEISRLLPKIKRAHPKSNLYSLRLMMDDRTRDLASTAIKNEYDEDFYDGWQAIAYVAGTTANEESATKARGFHREYMLVILEEASGMNRAIVNAFQNTCTGSFNYILAVGNPNNKADALNVLASQNNTKAFRVSALDHPNVVRGQELVPGAVTRASVLDREKVYGKDSRLYNSMVRGICPEQAYNSLIRAEWIEEADAAGAGVLLDGTYPAIGIDVAASENGDKAAAAYGRANVLTDLFEFQCPNASHLAYNVVYDKDTLAVQGWYDYGLPTAKERQISHTHIGVDVVGVGVSTVEAFREAGYHVTGLQGGAWSDIIPNDPYTGQPLYKFSNLRTQMYWELREDLRKGTIGLAVTAREKYLQLRQELLAINFDNKGGVIAIESKEAIRKKLGHSPNVADAVVYWNWMRKGHRQVTVWLPMAGGTGR